MSNKRKLSKCFMVNMIILIFISFMVTSRVLAQWLYSGTYSEPSIENQLYAAYGLSPEGVFIWPWGGRQYPISPYPTTSGLVTSLITMADIGLLTGGKHIMVILIGIAVINPLMALLMGGMD